MNLAWVEAEIEKTIDGPNTPQNVFDLAALCIARDELAKREAPKSPAPPPLTDEEQRRRDIIRLTDNSVDLDKTPTLAQIDSALGSYTVHSAAERAKVRDLRTWRQIISGGGD